MKNAILGIDIGGTKTVVLLGSVQAEIFERLQFSTVFGQPFHEYFSELVINIEKIINENKYNVIAISVSIGGPLDALDGIIKSPPNLPSWKNIPLKKMLSEKFNLPVYIEHDGNAGALAEYFFGAGRNFHNIVFLTLGTGFGAGIILDGKLYRGTSYTAGEIGHIRISDNGPFAYGKHGSLESFCSGAGIAKLAVKMFPQLWSDGITTKQLTVLAREENPQAIEVLNTSGNYLGRAFAIIADLLNPERIILGGLGFRIGGLLLQPALKVFKKEALEESFNSCEIVPAELNEKIGDVACLCAAIDQDNML